MSGATEQKPSDRILIDGCLRHEAQAVNDLYMQFRSAVHAGATRAIKRRLGISGTADDLTQEFFLLVVERPETVFHKSAEPSDFASWLTTVAFRQCSKMLRSPAWRWPGSKPIRQVRNLDSVPAPIPGTVHIVDVVRQGLDQLDEDSRGMIEARFGFGPGAQSLPTKEIRRPRGCSRATAYRRFGEACGHLQILARGIMARLQE